VVGFDPVVSILLGAVPCLRGEFVEEPWVDRCPVGGDLKRDPFRAIQRVLEEPPRCFSIALDRDVDVDDLAELVYRAVDVTPLPTHLT